jgi:hypothetical protein
MARQDDMPRHDDPTELEPRPRQPRPPGAHATTAQLRRDIDSGATRAKVAALDPAAAPLGTDDEAAAHGPSGATIATVRRAERGRGPQRPRTRPGSPLLFLAMAAGMAVIVFWLSVP